MKLAQYPGVVDITDSFRAGKEEIKLSILPSAEILGLTLEDLARQVRQAFYGEEAQRIQRDREDIRVMVRYPKSQRSSIGDLENMRIRTPAGGEVPFYSVARAELGRGFASIKRSDRQRVIDVIADLELGVANGNTIMADLRANFLPQLIADHPGLRYRLGGEQREQAKMVRGLIWGYGLAMILIYALLAIPLRSYAQPLIIMTAIPFGLIGAIGGHLLMGMGLSMMSIMGVVALSGVVVNSSLVLVHHLNEQRGRGASASEAARSAGVARFRPIALTSLSTFAGLTPLLLEESVSAQFLIPMAISLAFGVAFASTVTLFIVPSLYLVLDDALRFIRRFTRRGAAHDSDPGDPPTAAPTASAVGR
jgi:multidrug efflux pump subunit AcrB